MVFPLALPPREIAGGLFLQLTSADLQQLKEGDLVDQLCALAKRQERPRLFLDLSGIPTLEDGVLVRLLQLDRRLRALGGRLSLRQANPLFYQAFHICRLLNLFDGEEGDQGERGA